MEARGEGGKPRGFYPKSKKKHFKKEGVSTIKCCFETKKDDRKTKWREIVTKFLWKDRDGSQVGEN